MFVDDVLAARGRRVDVGRRAWPVGAGSVPFDGPYGHDASEFSPETYGDYLATSNEIFSAATLRARLMSTLRLRLFRGDDESKEAASGHPAARLLRYVNGFWTPRRLARMDELSMCVWGQSCWAVEREGRARRPVEIWWCKPPRMRPEIDASGYIDHYLYEPVYGGPVIRFEADEVVWFRYPNPLDEFAPLSPLAAARLAADAASAMMTANRNIFTNGLQVAGLVTPPDSVEWTEDQVDDMETILKRKATGADKAHRWLVMRNETRFTALGALTPKDAEYVAGLSLSLRQVGNAYGIPIPLLNDMTGATLSNVDAFTRILWAHALVPDSQLHAEEIEEQYLPMFGRAAPDHAEYDYNAIPALQEAASEVWSRDAQQMDRLAITVNEWRARNGLPPVKWGERPWAPLNKAQIGEDGKLQMPQQYPPELLAAIGAELDATGPGGEATLDEVAALPDDERNPVNQPPSPRGLAEIAAGGLGHMSARAFLAGAAPLLDAIRLPARANGHRR